MEDLLKYRELYVQKINAKIEKLRSNLTYLMHIDELLMNQSGGSNEALALPEEKPLFSTKTLASSVQNLGMVRALTEFNAAGIRKGIENAKNIQSVLDVLQSKINDFNNNMIDTNKKLGESYAIARLIPDADALKKELGEDEEEVKPLFEALGRSIANPDDNKLRIPIYQAMHKLMFNDKSINQAGGADAGKPDAGKPDAGKSGPLTMKEKLEKYLPVYFKVLQEIYRNNLDLKNTDSLDENSIKNVDKDDGKLFNQIYNQTFPAGEYKARSSLSRETNVAERKESSISTNDSKSISENKVDNKLSESKTSDNKPNYSKDEILNAVKKLKYDATSKDSLPNNLDTMLNNVVNYLNIKGAKINNKGMLAALEDNEIFEKEWP